MSPVAVAGVAAVSAFGLSWRGLARAVRDRTIEPCPTSDLPMEPGALAFQVPPLAPEQDAGDARARKAMSRPARLAAIAAREAIADARFGEARRDLGYFLGVGASGGPVSEMVAMLRASLDERGAVSLARLGAEGLSASNPLFTFHVLNNFTLCHGAILEGTQGPNAAFFSRGGGTVIALREAIAAIAGGDCDRALAGGADTAIHPATFSELRRDGFADLVPGEGAALLALGRAESIAEPLCFIGRVQIHPARRRPLDRALAAAARSLAATSIDHLVLAPWGEPARAALTRFAAEIAPRAAVLDVTRALGETLAASPALAWATAVDLVASGESARAAVVSLGVDGDVGVVTLSSEVDR
jgi:hypothetical protein